MSQRTFNILAKLAFVVILLVLCYAGLRSEPVPQAFNEQDKLHHWLGFFCVTVSAYFAFPRTRLFFLALWPLLGSMVIELEQSFQPLRSADWGDMLANATGVLCGLIVIVLWRRREAKKAFQAALLRPQVVTRTTTEDATSTVEKIS